MAGGARRSVLAALGVVGLSVGVVVAPSAHAAAARPAGHAARFRVGVAVASIDPVRPAYLGGYGAGPAGGTVTRHVNPLTGRPEELTVRAMAVESDRGGRRRVVELASVDSQGWFAGYQEGPYGISDVRAAAAGWLRSHGAPGTAPADIIVSSLHEHAVPSVYGVFSPAKANVWYLKQLAATTTRTLEQAYRNVRAATITAGTADAPWLGGGDVAEGNEFEGWKRDGSLVALWARDAASGRTIATYVSEPAYPNIVYGPTDLAGTGAQTLISSDFPAYAEAIIEARLGGVAVLASGSLANQASPLQADTAPSPDLPAVDGHPQTRAFDDIIQMGSAVANQVFPALAHGRPITEGTVAGAEQTVISPVTNPADSALSLLDVGDDGADWAPAGHIFTVWPDDRAFTPPYGYGAAFGTPVTTLRIGDVALVSEPGEFFGSIREALSRGIHAPGGVFVVGGAQDFLGYEYPAYVTPFTNLGGDELIFGPSATLGDQTVTAGETEAGSLGFPVDLTSNAETTALEQDYARMAQTGVWLLPSVTSGDLGPAGTFSPTLLAAADPARAAMGCDNPALLFTPGGCPGTDPALGPFSWRFGDGTGAVTPAQGRARASFSPFLRHAYHRPGVYGVTVSVTAGGSTDSMTLPIVVHPALHALVSRRGGSASASIRGGDGHLLFAVWTLPDGSHAFGPSVRLPRQHGALRLAVVDGTGTVATASVRV